MNSTKRLITGIKPTGDIHVGNYLGAMKQVLELQDSYDTFVFVPDLHALNQVQDAKEISRISFEIAKAYIAVGLDTSKVTLFRQSDVPQVTELCWIFNSITPMSLLELAHAYKDAQAKGKGVNVGLFDYPVLMAADILMYDAQVVPVGSDQKQHVEMAREIARAFNRVFGETFVEPQELIKDDVAVVPGTDGRKMSKSYGNVIGLFNTPEETTRQVMGIVTDSRGATEPKDPETCNIFALHKFFSTEQLGELEERYRAGTISYKESKELLAENINAFLAPVREKKAALDADEAAVLNVLEAGREKATALATEKMKTVRQRVGLRSDWMA